jgi:lipid-A-disaccharide synthase-like uncharacterized protein
MTENQWYAIGFAAQGVFTARFVVQWLASEQKRDSVVPAAFWWLSLIGGSTLLCYAIHKHDPVISLGQALGVFVYVRNLMLAAKGKRRTVRRQHRAEGTPIPKPHRWARRRKRQATQD